MSVRGGPGGCRSPLGGDNLPHLGLLLETESLVKTALYFGEALKIAYVTDWFM